MPKRQGCIIMKKINLAPLFLMVLFLAGCGADKHDKYLGYYKYSSGLKINSGSFSLPITLSSDNQTIYYQ